MADALFDISGVGVEFGLELKLRVVRVGRREVGGE